MAAPALARASVLNTYVLKRFARKGRRNRLWTERFTEPLHLNFVSAFVAPFGSFRAKVAHDQYLERTRFSHALYFPGSRPEIVSSAATRLNATFPKHRIAGWHHGYFEPSENARIVEDIKASGADLLLVGMGNLLQEFWINEHGARTGCRLSFGVGALFNFVSGETPRAPLWLRSLRAEWAWRLAFEPKRLWRRYVIGNVTFLAYVLRRREGRDA